MTNSPHSNPALDDDEDAPPREPDCDGSANCPASTHSGRCKSQAR